MANDRLGVARVTSIHEPIVNADSSTEQTLDLPPYVSGLAGKTKAQNWMHVAARAALLDRLVTNPKIVALFARWTSDTRIGRAVSDAGRCQDRLDGLAAILGKRRWSDFESV